MKTQWSTEEFDILEKLKDKRVLLLICFSLAALFLVGRGWGLIAGIGWFFMVWGIGLPSGHSLVSWRITNDCNRLPHNGDPQWHLTNRLGLTVPL